VIHVNQGRAVLELYARSGRAVLIRNGDLPAGSVQLRLPGELASALHEWAHVAKTLRRAGEDDWERIAQVSQRGRVLAARLASSTGIPVSYTNPISGGVEVLPPGLPEEPTPWGTGLTVSAATAVLVGVALFALSQSLASVGGWLVVVANLLVAAGLAPSIWLGRATPLWRWVAYGAAAAIPLTWLALLLSLLAE
jgi:hypothetical protein